MNKFLFHLEDNMRRYGFLGYVLLGIYLIIVGLGLLGVALPALRRAVRV